MDKPLARSPAIASLQAAAFEQLYITQQQLEVQTQQCAASHAILRSISRALPPTLMQQSRDQVGNSREVDCEGGHSALSSARPEEVLEQLQSFVHAVQADQDRCSTSSSASLHQTTTTLLCKNQHKNKNHAEQHAKGFIMLQWHTCLSPVFTSLTISPQRDIARSRMTPSHTWNISAC